MAGRDRPIPSRRRAPAPPTAPPGRTLGPLADLERHLPSDWWNSLFNALYLKTDGDVVENDRNTRTECDLFERAAALRPEHRILDVCCGQGRHVLELARRGYPSVSGVDRSRYLIRLARKRARQESWAATFHEGDARRLRFEPESFDRVSILGNSFGYFEQARDDLSVIQSIARILAPGGLLFLDIADGDWLREHFEPRSWEWIDGEHFVCRERALSADGHRLISREVVVHAEKGVIADQFYAERLYSAAGLQRILESNGFEEVRLHGAVEAVSERDQDLGMMAHRFAMTASAIATPRRRGTAPTTSRFPIEPKVTVLLGDPRRPDAVKLGGRFGEADLETVDRLRGALAEIPGLDLSYHDDHATLVRRLSEDRPGFVLNLCDEGFGNDPFKELHVPALLDLFDIPYSGAGPACLGLCYDKALVCAVAASLDIPVPLETTMRAGEHAATLPSAFPVLIKPNEGDSSQGIPQGAVVESSKGLLRTLRRLGKELPGRSVLIQEFLTGTEYTVGVLGNPGQGLQALPILEVDYSRLDPSLPQILGYESKWNPDSPYWTDVRYVATHAPESVLVNLQERSLRLFERLGCRDYARFDFRADAQGEVKLLEVNPNPGWCWDGKLNLMAELAGWSYADLLRRILQAGQERAFGEPRSTAVAVG